MLASLGIAALAALGATGALSSPGTDLTACSVHPSVLAELPSLIEAVASVPAAHQADWCTEKDGLLDPRCDAPGRGSVPGAPSTSSPTSAPEADLGVPVEAPARLVRDADPPPEARRSATTSALDAPFRPPRR